jgi:hypothetical protein
MSEFFDWMVDNDYSPATAKSYTSSGRRIVNELGAGLEDQEAVNTFFLELHESNPVAYPNVYGAWKVMIEWAADQGRVLPSPRAIKHLKKRAEASTGPSLPPEVRVALRQLRAAACTPNHVPKITWSDVDLTEMARAVRTHVQVPGKRESWLLPSDAMKVLWGWGQVNTGPELDLSTPLVPHEPGSHQPYSYYALRREIEIYDEKELSEKTGLVFSGPPGSAMGGSPAAYSKVPADVMGELRAALRPPGQALPPPAPTTKALLELLAQPQPGKSELALRYEVEAPVEEEEEAGEEEEDDPFTDSPENLDDALGYDPDAKD